MLGDLLMEIGFVTNIISLHQMALWDSFCSNNELYFSYIYTLKSTPEYKRYLDRERFYCVYSKQISSINDYLDRFDLLIISPGCIHDDRINNYLKGKNNLILYTEHFSKNSIISTGIRKYIYIFKHIIHRSKVYRDINRNSFILSSSSHAGHDYCLTGFKKKNIFKFGYFINYSYNFDLSTNHNILFCGRNLEWKHPEDAYYVFNYLSKYDKYHLNIIGLGFDNSESDLIHIHEELEHEDVIDIMHNSEIFIFSSTREEGWGVVLSEAMAAGLIVFANINAGSTSFLVKNGFNGFTYKNRKQLTKRLRLYCKLSDNEKLKLRNNAVKTIKNLWNADIASKRLFDFCLSKVNNTKTHKYKNGPLSRDRCRF